MAGGKPACSARSAFEIARGWCEPLVPSIGPLVRRHAARRAARRALIVLLAATHPRSASGALKPLCAGALLAIAVVGLYIQPYIENARELGTRDAGNELRLFPGVVPVVLSVVALERGTSSRVLRIYLALVAIAVELSLGFNGSVYRWLHGHLWGMEAFRLRPRVHSWVPRRHRALRAPCAGGFLA